MYTVQSFTQDDFGSIVKSPTCALIRTFDTAVYIVVWYHMNVATMFSGTVLPITSFTHTLNKDMPLKQHTSRQLYSEAMRVVSAWGCLPACLHFSLFIHL